MQDLPSNEEGLFYTSQSGFQFWISKNLAGLLSSDIPNDPTPNEDKILIALMGAESVVDGYLSAGGFVTPVPPDYKRAISYLRVMCYSFASYELYSASGVTQEVYYKYSQACKTMEKIANGVINLGIPTVDQGSQSGSSFFSEFSDNEAIGRRISI